MFVSSNSDCISELAPFILLLNVQYPWKHSWWYCSVRSIIPQCVLCPGLVGVVVRSTVSPPLMWPSGQVRSNMDIYTCFTFSKHIKGTNEAPKSESSSA